MSGRHEPGNARAVHLVAVAGRADLAGQAASAALVALVAPTTHLAMALAPVRPLPRDTAHTIDLEAEHAFDRALRAVSLEVAAGRRHAAR